jgi:hypothetical protein
MPSVATMPTLTCYSWRLSVDGTVGGVGVVGILCWDGNANNAISADNAPTLTCYPLRLSIDGTVGGVGVVGIPVNV